MRRITLPGDPTLDEPGGTVGPVCQCSALGSCAIVHIEEAS